MDYISQPVCYVPQTPALLYACCLNSNASCAPGFEREWEMTPTGFIHVTPQIHLRIIKGLNTTKIKSEHSVNNRKNLTNPNHKIQNGCSTYLSQLYTQFCPTPVCGHVATVRVCVCKLQCNALRSTCISNNS